MMTIAEALEMALQQHQAGRLADAEALYRQILAVQPTNADARHLIGVVAYQSGRHELAVEWIRQALAVAPGNPAAHSNLGEAYRALGRSQEAIAAYRQALALKPNYPEAWNNLGIALADLGKTEEAITAYRRAVELKPDFASAHNNLSNVFKDCGRFEEAVAAYRRAIELRPDFAEAYSNLGVALKEQGRYDEAIAAYRQALQLKPDYGKAHSNLGVALAEQGRLDEAVAAYERALQLVPSLAETHNNLGNVLKDKGLLDEAAAAICRALELRPDLAGARSNLGNVFKDQGRLDEAIGTYRRALELQPGRSDLHSNLIYALHFQPGDADAQVAEEQARWNRQFGAPLKSFAGGFSNYRDPDRPLRVGYVSSDLRDHVIGRNLLPLFRHHDTRVFEIFCYAEVVRPDDFTSEFRERSRQWQDTAGLADEALANIIRKDGVDILVDLTQHMAGNRLPVFVRQPAPVQVSFAGYPESTGVESIRYRISDRWLEGEPRMPAERSETACGRHGANAECRMPKEGVFLLDSFWCYDPCGVDLEVGELPGGKSSRITFGSLNNFCKINEPLLRLWARVLRQVEDSRLVLLSGFGSHRQRTVELLEREGIARQRVEFVQPCPRKGYLGYYHRLDVVLDTYPYNGHTTSLDALWMGVPVVSLAGNSPVSRAGFSQLSNLGLPELVAHSEDEYVSKASQLAHDFPRLAGLRHSLRGAMQKSVLMDAPRFATDIERAYRAMWQHWCATKASP